ncbi:HAMP domain-containing sensor histidine kinase [Nonomuraea fuscirosea]|jgi:signal transduction histidine kinase|uniref:sensor histidine kinase n=1 Tax=Nonomuraea fuscirosea TaxID=1291556 RepID=UPI002DD8BBC3|nr:HAMP domain-containing sensor histidine kinase [Nonomuraea fuscirosea]WSA53753.1 HAMP domain-containing histidine kinase [Nonomuraea fuscirosea]
MSYDTDTKDHNGASWIGRRSVRASCTLIVALFASGVLVVLGATLDLAIRSHVESSSFRLAEEVASRWSPVARQGLVPRPIPAGPPVGLIQVVDVHDRVVDSSRDASATVPLSRHRPPPDARFQPYRECPPDGRCVLLQAIRLTPAADAGVVYAGIPEPELLATHQLEYAIAAGIVAATGIAAWAAWVLVGRALRPVEAIRARISQITVSDLSLRVPEPQGDDEISRLATTANHTLGRLEGAVEQLRRFASTTSHELRTPIAGMRTQLEEALLYPDDVAAEDALRGALSTVGRLEAIVDDLLLLARLRAADPLPAARIDLGELVAAEVSARPSPVPIKVDTPAGLKILGSRIQLIRVLDNLLANASRHAESAVTVSVGPAGDGVAVTVADDGPGIPPDQRERVFDRFVRLDDGRRRDPGGSGLGLAISRDIAHAHRGTLTVEDSPRGARFVLWLPLIGGGPATAPRT